MSALENKIPPPLVAGIFGIFMWWISTVAPLVEPNSSVRQILSVAIFLSGLFFCVAGVVSFRRAKTTVNPLKPETASSLVDSGIYRISRNPMYLGFALLLLSLSVFLSSSWSLVGVVGFVLYMNAFQITPEERALEAIFESGYTSYKSQVRRWL
jgi:protein-S-isoprenylcysteine O-methyltransferase Ste14